MARQNAIDSLESCLAAVADGRDRDPEFLAEIVECYHFLGIAVLLERADADAFATLLALAGQADCQLRSLDLSQHPERRIASRAEPFCDALTAGDLESARTIARLAPREHQVGWEYEDDFLRFRCQHALILGEDDAAIAGLLKRWQAVLDGASSAHLDAAKALHERDAAALDAALQAMADERQQKLDAWRKTPIYDEQLDATEGAILVRGLALLRLAEMRGLQITAEHPYMPSLARVRLGLRLPPPESWRQVRIPLSFA